MATSTQNGIDSVMLASQQITDGATATANLDTRGSDAATIRVNLGTEETTHATAIVCSLLSSDDTVVTNFATVVADQSPDLTTGREVRYAIDMRGQKRYLRLDITAGTQTGSNLDLGAIATLTRNTEDPASTTAMGDDTVVII